VVVVIGVWTLGPKKIYKPKKPFCHEKGIGLKIKFTDVQALKKDGWANTFPMI
jgi:hypothetical protein